MAAIVHGKSLKDSAARRRKKPVTPRMLGSWVNAFREAAENDDASKLYDQYALLDLIYVDGLCEVIETGEQLELVAPITTKTLIDNTIMLVLACIAYGKLDGRDCAAFLARQNYDPAEAPISRYCVTFDISGNVAGRILVDDLDFIDFADLLNHPWYEHEVCGYRSVTITRVDGADLSEEERTALKEEIIYDLRFDFGEDELGIWFDDLLGDDVLKVRVWEKDGKS